MQKTEILAPAGAWQQLEAAVRAGADAVYLSLSGSLNARRGAAGFTPDELRDAVRLCHEAGTQVHLTLNTLVYDEEKKLALNALETACDAGVDAVIVQDVGLASLIRSCAPEMPMHASTQMTVHSRNALYTLKEMGFSRAVLSRELSGEEIAVISRDAPIETEVFIHGALCMSVSGQCLFSSVLGGRSGNRGMCAQPCRLPFVSNGFENCLSLKDMSHIRHIPFLTQAGVTSLKIEGRLKRPEYVAAAVTACREMRDTGTLSSELEDELRSVFSRSGFTDGYFTGRRGSVMFGVRTKEDAFTPDTLSSLHELYRTQKPKVPLEVGLSLTDRAVLTVSDGERTATSEVPAVKDEANPLTAQRAEKQLSRLGGTPYYIEKFDFDNSACLSMPTSSLNALRRGALEELSERRKSTGTKKYIKHETTYVPHAVKREGLDIFFRRAEQIPKNISTCADGINAVFLPLESDWDSVPEIGIEICAEAPRTLFAGEESFSRQLEAFAAKGGKLVAVHNIGQIDLVKQAGLTVYGGFSLNAVSTASIEELERLGVSECEMSFETSAKQINALGGTMPRKINIYGHIPMMLTRNCPASLNGCRKSGCTITDRRGEILPVLCRQGASEIFNCIPLSITEKQSSFPNADGFTLRFTVEDAAECEKVICAAVSGTATVGKATNGLYFRQVL